MDAMELAAVFPVAGSMVRTADHEGIAPLLLPSVEQPSQLTVHIPQSSHMASQIVMGCTVQIKIIGIMDGIHIQVKENMCFLLCGFYFFQNKVHLVFRTVFHRAAKRRVPVAFLEKPGEYLSDIRTLIEK